MATCSSPSGYTENSIVHGEGWTPASGCYRRSPIRGGAGAPARHIIANQKQINECPRREARLPSTSPWRRSACVFCSSRTTLVRSNTAEMLLDMAHQVTEAADGAEALEFLQANEIDVLMADIRFARCQRRRSYAASSSASILTSPSIFATGTICQPARRPRRFCCETLFRNGFEVGRRARRVRGPLTRQASIVVIIAFSPKRECRNFDQRSI